MSEFPRSAVVGGGAQTAPAGRPVCALSRARRRLARLLWGGGGLACGLVCASLALADNLAPIPSLYRALSGNDNYRMYSDCKPLENPRVIIDVAKAMYGGLGGFDFQFNANSFAISDVNGDTDNNPQPWGARVDGSQAYMGWQQYILNVRAGKEPNTTEITAFIEPWPSNAHPATGDTSKPVSNGSDLVHQTFPIVTLLDTPQPMLPAGAKVEIRLMTQPQTLAVEKILFKVSLPPGVRAKSDPGGHGSKFYNGEPIALVGLPLESGLCKGTQKIPHPDPRFCPPPRDGGRLEEKHLTPVSTFQLDIAGPWVNRGEGSITYEAGNGERLVPVPNDVPLNPDMSRRLPHCTAGSDTAEGSNLIYSALPVDGGVQTFRNAPDCGEGTKPYYLLCDESAFCAAPEFVKTCASEGWCYPVETANVKEQGKNACKNVTSIDKRDPRGEWLKTVSFPYPLPGGAAPGSTAASGTAGGEGSKCPAGARFNAETGACVHQTCEAPFVGARPKCAGK